MGGTNGERQGLAKAWQRWLVEALAQPGKGRADMARHLRLDPAQITRMCAGTRIIQVTELPEIAAYLERDVPLDCVGLSHHGVSKIEIVGVVQEGLWYNPALPKANGCLMMPYVPDPKYRGLKHLAVTMQGNSVNRFIPDQFSAVYVPYWRARKYFRDGDFVLLERTRHPRVGNKAKRVSRAIRRVAINGKGVIELRTDSTDRRLNGTITLAPDHQHDAKTRDGIEIIGLVVWRGGPLA